MKSRVEEFLEPSNKEKQDLWENAVFVFDTNVLLNLYRYSAKTRNSLLEAFEILKDRMWIPYQVAYEYMNKRCEVIYDTVQRYEQFKKEIDNFKNKAIETLRLTSNDDEISELNRYLYKWLDNNKDNNLLVLSTEDDEILHKLLDLFNGRVGEEYSEEEIKEICKQGEERYKKKIPPGYRDEKKKKEQDDYNNAYGDLIIWKQIIRYSHDNNVNIIYVTHDQKEDWWNIVKGKTIGPRIELRREFKRLTNQRIHMYSMKSFIAAYNLMNEKQIDKSAVNEVNELENSKNERNRKKRKNDNLGINERIARTEETILKLENRIIRRKRIINDIEGKYQENGIELPENIQTQYDNTQSKISELEIMLNGKKEELAALKSMID